MILINQIKKSAIIFLSIAILLPACSRENITINEPKVDETNKQKDSSELIIIKKDPNVFSSSSFVSALKTIKEVKTLGVEIVKVPEGKTAEEFIKELEADPSIEYAEQNFERKISVIDTENETIFNTKFFNDPELKKQYGLKNINAEAAWKITKGNGKVIVAVIDTGVDLNHPDLKQNLVSGYSTVNGKIDPKDDNGHGTHVSGIIAGIANNGKGIAGIAPRTKIMPIKVLNVKGAGNDSDIAEGIVWAVDHGAKIINMSLGGPGEGRTLESAMKYAYNNDVLVVAAMGNNGKRLKHYPAAYNNVIAVGATDQQNKVASFSNYGNWITVAAPGHKIISTFPTYRVEMSKFNISKSYGTLSGTSMSSPFVAGLASLIISKSPNVTRKDLRKKIEVTAKDVDKPGFDINTGFGLINAQKALGR